MVRQKSKTKPHGRKGKVPTQRAPVTPDSKQPVWYPPKPLRLLAKICQATAETYKILDNPSVVKLLEALRGGSYALVIEVAGELTPQLYSEMPLETAYGLNQLAALVAKVPFEDPKLQPEASAWKKFRHAEHVCKRINQRLAAEKRTYRYRYLSIRGKAREFIRNVLGDSPPLRQIYSHCDFGPGASVGVHGETTHLLAKLASEEWTCTRTCFDYAYAAICHNPQLWRVVTEDYYGDITCFDPEILRECLARRVKFVDGNLITMVPKNAKVHRTIAIEPLLNGYLQKGVDEWMRKRLLKIGIDLRYQAGNQWLAYIGSLGGFNPFVTLDLAAASDSIAKMTVKDLLPPEWYEFLCCLLSPCYTTEDGEVHSYHKFTSMGNGFTFPLETLIFAALAHSVGVETGDCDEPARGKKLSLGKNVLVYGDDIIVRQSSALYLTEILKFYGFRLNSDKSFITGGFRESCGADYFKGKAVRPYYIKSFLDSEGELYQLGNAMRDSVWPNDAAWDIIYNTIPDSVRKVRPYPGSPNSALTVELDVAMKSPLVKWDRREQRWSWSELQTRSIPDLRRVSSEIGMYGALGGATPSQEGSPQFSLRRKTRTVTRRNGLSPDTHKKVDMSTW